MKMQFLRRTVSKAIVVLSLTGAALSATAQFNRKWLSHIQRPCYLGFEFGASTQHLQLKSMLPHSTRTTVSSGGATVGVKVASRRMALRPHIGLYFAKDAGPCSQSMVEGGTNGHVYLLRLAKIRRHTLEPYGLVSVFYQQLTFRCAIPADDERNYSLVEERKRGTASWVNAGVGLGVEYQLENDVWQFLHFFAEAKCGRPFLSRGSGVAFSQQAVTAPIAFAVGMSFGRTR